MMVKDLHICLRLGLRDQIMLEDFNPFDWLLLCSLENKLYCLICVKR